MSIPARALRAALLSTSLLIAAHTSPALAGPAPVVARTPVGNSAALLDGDEIVSQLWAPVRHKMIVEVANPIGALVIGDAYVVQQFPSLRTAEVFIAVTNRGATPYCGVGLRDLVYADTSGRAQTPPSMASCTARCSRRPASRATPACCPARAPGSSTSSTTSTSAASLASAHGSPRRLHRQERPRPRRGSSR
jgi:hypothetical protein